MIEALMAGKLIVPLSEPPKLNGEELTSWHPSTVSKSDGSQWLVAFTDSELAGEFSKSNPAFGYQFESTGKFLVNVIPPGHGLVVNIGAVEHMFEWDESGMSGYKAVASN